MAVVRTTVVGSWWLHPENEQSLRDYHAGKLSSEQGEAVLRRAAITAIKEQRDLGLDEWTGGEYFTHDFVTHLHHCLTGLEVTKVGEAEPFDYDDLTEAKIVGKIEAPDGLGYLAAYRRERSLPGGVRKAAVVSPNEVVIVAREHVEAINQQMPTLTAIVNRELRAMADEGCPNVQLDAPIVGTLVNLGAMTGRQAADFIAPCFEGVRAKKSLHMCNGNLRGRPVSSVLRCAPWVGILQHLDGIVDVAIVEVKYFSQFQERAAFKDLPKSMAFAAGIVDEACYWVEPVKKIRERIADWARVVGEERLWVSPSCGFGRHSPRDIPVLRAKVENMVEAARTL
jgi:methionine synthase II (cobalamin-independent)